MTAAIVLDAGPLGLICQRPGVATADVGRERAAAKADAGVRIIVSEVADNQPRRELVRIGRAAAVRPLDGFLTEQADRSLPITTAAMRRAAIRWADVRQRGLPTADHKGLDGDVILAAQVLTSTLLLTDALVATTNAVHLARFVPAQLWSMI